MSARAKKILITNTVALNGGDAAILQSILFLLRGAFGEKTHFIVYDNSPEVAARYYPEIEFRKLLYWRAVPKTRIGIIRSVAKRWNLARMRWATRFWKCFPATARILLTNEERIDIRNYSDADLIVSTGGTYLVDHYSLAPRIFDYELSLRLGRPLVFFTQSLGPFQNQSSSTHRKLRTVFASARLILLRDEQSLKNLHALNLREAKTKISADAVFALADPTVLKRASQASFPSSERMKIAISVRDWRRFATVSRKDGMQKYTAALQILTTHLVQRYAAEVVFISTCQGIPEYQFDDSSVAAEIFNGLREEIKSRVRVDSGFRSPTDLIAHLQQFDLAISTRMHFCILSLLAGVPVFPIAYEFKTYELFTRLGLGEWVQNIETIEPTNFVKSFDAFARAIPDLRDSLFSKVELERQRALQSGMDVKAALENAPQSSQN